MDFIISLAAVPSIFVLAYLANLTPGPLKGLGTHPFNVVGMLFAIVVVDFLVLSTDVRTTFVRSVFNYRVTTSQEVQAGAFFFLMCAIAALGGIAAATTLARRKRAGFATSPAQSVDDRGAVSAVMAIMGILLLIVAFYLLTTSLASGSALYVAGQRTMFFRENALAYILIAMTVPAFLLYGSRFGPTRSTWFYGLLLLVCLPLVGSRSLLLYTLAGLAFWVATKVNLRLLHVYLAIPAIGILSVVYRFFSRDIYRYSEFDQFLDWTGGFFDALFRTNDIAFAELITIGVNNRIVERAWTDSWIGALVAPLPRSIVPWKPLGASSDFTNYTSAQFFEITGSSKTVTGFIDVYLGSNYILAPLIVGAIAFIWASFWIRSQNDPVKSSLAGPVLAISAYLFVRSDLYNLSLFVWPLIFVLILKWLIQVMMSGLPRRRRSVGRQAVGPRPGPPRLASR